MVNATTNAHTMEQALDEAQQLIVRNARKVLTLHIRLQGFPYLFQLFLPEISGRRACLFQGTSKRRVEGHLSPHLPRQPEIELLHESSLKLPLGCMVVGILIESALAVGWEEPLHIAFLIFLTLPIAHELVLQFPQAHIPALAADDLLYRCTECKSIVTGLEEGTLVSSVLHAIGKGKHLVVAPRRRVEVGGKNLADGQRGKRRRLGANDADTVARGTTFRTFRLHFLRAVLPLLLRAAGYQAEVSILLHLGPTDVEGLRIQVQLVHHRARIVIRLGVGIVFSVGVDEIDVLVAIHKILAGLLGVLVEAVLIVALDHQPAAGPAFPAEPCRHGHALVFLQPPHELRLHADDSAYATQLPNPYLYLHGQVGTLAAAYLYLRTRNGTKQTFQSLEPWALRSTCFREHSEFFVSSGQTAHQVVNVYDLGF